LHSVGYDTQRRRKNDIERGALRLIALENFASHVGALSPSQRALTTIDPRMKIPPRRDMKQLAPASHTK
jgi:hypothetical protein